MIGKTNAGAGGGHLNDTDALLRVSAPAHSIVTITKGSTVKSDHGHENADNHSFYDYYFIIHQSQFDSENPWTVTATLGEKSTSDIIIIDLADEYDVLLQYQLDLYTPGNVHTDVTGGWSATTGGNYVQFGSESISFTNADNFPIVSTDDTIPLSNYSTLCVDIKANSYGSSGNIYVGIADSRITTDNQFTARVKKTTTGREILSLDISAYDDSKYVAIAGYHSNANIYNVWLE